MCLNSLLCVQIPLYLWWHTSPLPQVYKSSNSWHHGQHLLQLAESALYAPRQRPCSLRARISVLTAQCLLYDITLQVWRRRWKLVLGLFRFSIPHDNHGNDQQSMYPDFKIEVGGAGFRHIPLGEYGFQYFFLNVAQCFFEGWFQTEKNYSSVLRMGATKNLQ